MTYCQIFGSTRGLLLNKANQHLLCSFVRERSRAFYYRDNTAAWLVSGVAVELGNLMVEIRVKVPHRQHPDSRRGLVAVQVASKSMVTSDLAPIEKLELQAKQLRSSREEEFEASSSIEKYRSSGLLFSSKLSRTEDWSIFCSYRASRVSLRDSLTSTTATSSEDLASRGCV